MAKSLAKPSDQVRRKNLDACQRLHKIGITKQDLLIFNHVVNHGKTLAPNMKDRFEEVFGIIKRATRHRYVRKFKSDELEIAAFGDLIDKYHGPGAGWVDLDRDGDPQDFGYVDTSFPKEYTLEGGSPITDKDTAEWYGIPLNPGHERFTCTINKQTIYLW